MRVSAAVILMTLATPALADCVVADPSPTPLNVRAAPNGRIVGSLANGHRVYVIDRTFDHDSRPWVYVGDAGTRDPIGWVFRDFIVCRGEVR